MCLTELRYVDEVENDEEGIAEEALNDERISETPRPATSLRKTAVSTSDMPSQIVRPRTRTGRPLTGVTRPGTEMSQGDLLERVIRSARTATTARPVTSVTGRHMRLGTSAMMSDASGSYLNISRLNFAKYAEHPTLSKVLFEYIFYHENDVRN
ncbi:unnamed protein product, partial [Soboliphyme baturini]|uniref:Uncharacterized protein n=1 Tax=Soboliphyme baturini TaxID=241478 RepID=A0A183JAJ7_9BILA